MLYKRLWHKLLAVLVVTAGCAVPMNGQEKQLSDISKHIDIYTSLLKELELNYVDTLNHERISSCFGSFNVDKACTAYQIGLLLTSKVIRYGFVRACFGSLMASSFSSVR